MKTISIMVKRTRVLDVPVRVERAEGRMRIMEAGTPTNAQIASELEAEAAAEAEAAPAAESEDEGEAVG